MNQNKTDQKFLKGVIRVGMIEIKIKIPVELIALLFLLS